MSRKAGRVGPSDPQDILRRNAELRAAARRIDKTPSLWGVSAEIHVLPTASDVELNHDNTGRVVGARRRSDPFELLYAAGGLSDGQHRAADRLFRDWALRSGVRDYDLFTLDEKVEGRGPGGGLTQSMVDAGRRIAVAMSGVGPVNAKLLQALIEPFVRGEVRAWRGIVERVTGETHRNSQGTVVRQACEALRLVYQHQDEVARREKLERKDQRSFGTFENAET